MTDKDDLRKGRLFEGEAYRSITHLRPEPDTAPPTEMPAPEAQDHGETPAAQIETQLPPEPPKDDAEP
jgi:hypothetical protein